MITLVDISLKLECADESYEASLAKCGFESVVLDLYGKLSGAIETCDLVCLSDLIDLYLEKVQILAFEYHGQLTYEQENDKWMAISDDLFTFTCEAQAFVVRTLMVHQLSFGQRFYPQGKTGVKEIREVYTPQQSLRKDVTNSC